VERENDVRLIQDTLSGDDTAFNILVQKYQKNVHALVWRKVGDFHYAEEITQDTFLQAYKKLSTLRNPNQFAGWLYVIANRRCINWLQRRKPAMQSLEDTPAKEIEKVAYIHYQSEQRTAEVAEHRYERAKRLLQKLPESQRTVMTLYYLGDMTAKEISKFLGVSVNTISSRLRRARKHLQDDQERLIQEVLGGVPVPASLTENIMRQVANMNITPHPMPKPVTPWLAFGTAALLIALLFGASSQYLVRFQKPYSFEAASQPTIEIIDAPVVLETHAKPALRNQGGRAVTTRKTIGAGLHGSETASTSDTSVYSKEAEAWMPDPALRAAVREKLALPADVPLTKDRMQGLRHLKAGGKRITNIKGLEFARNLVNLHLGSADNHITDLTPLATLTSLMDLNVGGNQITDLRPLVNLTNLIGLSLWNNQVTDVSPLRSLTSLVYLNLANNHVNDLSPLANLVSLETLDLTHNHIGNINPLSGLANLRTLWIKENPVRDLSPLAGLNLTDLKYDSVWEPTEQAQSSEPWISNPALWATVPGDFGLLSSVPLTEEKMQKLEWQNANHKAINNTNLREPRLRKNSVIDSYSLTNLTQLEQSNFWRTPVNPTDLDLRPLTNHVDLKVISLGKNGISAIRPFAELTRLQQLWINRSWANGISPPPELNLTKQTLWAVR
jgi:RNA polymerase sigma factor (sigma-70 family)